MPLMNSRLDTKHIKSYKHREWCEAKAEAIANQIAEMNQISGFTPDYWIIQNAEGRWTAIFNNSGFHRRYGAPDVTWAGGFLFY